MIEGILASLLVASLCSTGVFFLKWWETKKENDRLQTENLKVKQERMDADKKRGESDTKVLELQSQILQKHPVHYVERRVSKVPIQE